MRESSLNILLIASNQSDVDFIFPLFKKMRLHQSRPQVHHTSSCEGAKVLLQENHFNLMLVVLDSSTPLEKLPDLLLTSGSVPLVIIGQVDPEGLGERMIHEGVQDYIPKQELTAPLLKRVILLAIERHLLLESVKSLTFKDELTGVYNRRGFMTLLTQQIALANRLNKGFYLLIADLDHMKKINDTYGHLAGDKAIKGAAFCLTLAFRRYDVIGRIGGDEFAVLALNAHKNSGTYLKNLLKQIVEEYNQTQQAPFSLSISLGGTYFQPYRNPTLEELLQEADRDLYSEKEKKNSQPYE